MNRLLEYLPRPFRPPVVLAECFVLLNIAFLAVDIYVAHSMNEFAHQAEWIPFVFSLAAPVVLMGCLLLKRQLAPLDIAAPDTTARRVATYGECLVGLGAILVGIAGLLWHLESQFFHLRTLQSLVYTAPFVAPLAYTGVGLIILLNRTIDARHTDWARWVIVLALGGFVGNFVLSLADHAQNGFFNPWEWVAVAASAVAVGALSTLVYCYRDAAFRGLVLWIMVAQIAVSLLGWGFHVKAILASSMQDWWQSVIFSAPVFAPLLFANLAILAMIGILGLETSPSISKPIEIAHQSQ